MAGTFEGGRGKAEGGSETTRGHGDAEMGEPANGEGEDVLPNTK
jgi:hypothetical protein